MSASSLPLLSRRILVTRAPQQASELAERLKALGATPLLIPTIEIAPPASYDALDAALCSIDEFDLVAFTSANAVEAFRTRSESFGLAPAPRNIAVVGPSTAKAVEKIGLHANLVPPVFTAESLAETLAPTVRGMRILLVLAADAPPTLRNGLTTAGADVTVATAYSNRIPHESLQMIQELFRPGCTPLDAVTFTSASTARNLVALLEAAGLTLPERVVRASIGPITSRTLSELGIPHHVQASESTIASLVEALAVHFQSLLL